MAFPYYSEYQKIFGLALEDQTFYSGLMTAISKASNTSEDLKDLLEANQNVLGISTPIIAELQGYLNGLQTEASAFKAACEQFKIDVTEFSNDVESC